MDNYKINNKKPEVEGKSKKIYKLDENTYFMCFKPHLRSITYRKRRKYRRNRKRETYC